jgi:hypothetical protein
MLPELPVVSTSEVRILPLRYATTSSYYYTSTCSTLREKEFASRVARAYYSIPGGKVTLVLYCSKIEIYTLNYTNTYSKDLLSVFVHFNA